MIEIRSLKPVGQIPSAMLNIAEQCFGKDFIAREVLQTTWFNNPKGTRIYAAYEDNQLLAFNFFLAHRASVSGDSRLVFQSCHSGTGTAARGRGLFSAIIKHAKVDLAAQGDFIIGFPNSKSAPIFLNKLGFKAIPLTRIYVPCILPSLSSMLFNVDAYSRALADQTLVSIDHAATADWKKLEHPGRIIKFEYEGNLIWGRNFERSIAGQKLIIFDAGGCYFGDPLLLKKTLVELRRIEGVDFVRFVCSSNSLLGQSWHGQLSGDKTEPLIWFPLKEGLGTPNFDIHTGLKDVY